MKKLILAVVAGLILISAFAQAQAEKEQPKNREYQLLPKPLQFPASRFIEVGYRELGGNYFVVMSPTVTFGFGRAFIKISKKEYEYGALTVLPLPNNPRHGK
jgi:hypothetical protein